MRGFDPWELEPEQRHELAAFQQWYDTFCGKLRALQRLYPSRRLLRDHLSGHSTAWPLLAALTAWLRDVRRRAAAGEQLERLAAALVPELVEKEHGRWRYQLSFRLLLRDRFRRYVESRGWTPQGPRFHEVDAAFDALTRRRIGELARAAAADPDAGDLREGWELVCAEFVD